MQIPLPVGGASSAISRKTLSLTLSRRAREQKERRVILAPLFS